ncbi:MAG: alkaline phosphatase family protein [Nitrososphaerota archaeon]|jgi:predicted AlkP superfamily pyrophosphatase or phosphodiesterase|uniref:alkaline phosphatase family protein n=1 Tax=Candidatus Bathycorpusculum sp. TaxID=2994959 RepID=UPI00283755E8|nr:alkaline phosphatase family protein [Candidatus Termitimicrobium sp.]MCL2431522.1 alkaline phosphatase family protein [Candidatus Termitimicrobium sp.]MDR0493592.1 alkaline phosphatase family protein [Nitrososphaerota archaeon]
MTTGKSQTAVKTTSNSFVYPQYHQNCISNIPKLILQLLEIQTAEHSPLKNRIETESRHSKIVLLVIDGFGFSHLQKHQQQNPFLSSLASKGSVSPITSVYPSQTTNALMTLNTGLTPQEHGVFEYYIYLKEVGVVNALRFECIGTKQRKLSEKGFSPSLMFRGKNIHQTLKDKGVQTFTHIHTTNASGACSKLIFEGSTIVPAQKTSDLIVNLRKNLERVDDGYFFVHLDSLDTISHEYGPKSDQFTAELSAITYLLQKELIEKIDNKVAKETLLLITADHGAIDTNPNDMIYLNRTQKPLTYWQHGKDRKCILPTGSPRDIFLHIKEEKLKKTKEALTQQIGSKAQVIETSKAAEAGLFGIGEASHEFFERAGNLLILPYDKETIWFSNPEGRKITLFGQHGGLNSEEMLVPFAAVNLEHLRNKH